MPSSTEDKKESLAIWWVSQTDMLALPEEDLPAWVPDYILSLYSSATGRNGRGRLWVPPSIDLKKVDWNTDGQLSTYLGMHCAGLVIHRDDALLVASLLGCLTDLAVVPLDLRQDAQKGTGA